MFRNVDVVVVHSESGPVCRNVDVVVEHSGSGPVCRNVDVHNMFTRRCAEIRYSNIVHAINCRITQYVTRYHLDSVYGLYMCQR